MAKTELVRRARDGDRDAYDRLVTESVDAMYRVARLESKTLERKTPSVSLGSHSGGHEVQAIQALEAVERRRYAAPGAATRRTRRACSTANIRNPRWSPAEKRSATDSRGMSSGWSTACS